MVQPGSRQLFYKRADVFVLPSRCERGIIEAWGLTVNEALECGVPVVVSDIVGAGYDIVDSYNGVVFSNGNIEQLAKSIDYVINNDYDKKQSCRAIKGILWRKWQIRLMKQLITVLNVKREILCIF